jgi:hypothetical protein
MGKHNRRIEQADYMKIKDDTPSESKEWFADLCNPSVAAKLNKAIQVELEYQAEEAAYESARAKKNKQTPPKADAAGFVTNQQTRRRQEKAAALGMNVSQYVRFKKAQRENSNAEQ